MLSRFIERGWVVVVMLVVGFVLTAFTPDQSQAKKRHSGKTVRKTSHSALHKRHSKFSARKHRANLHPLSSAEKAEIIGKIKSLATAEAVAPEATASGEDQLAAEDIAQAAKEEQAEDNIEVSFDKFLAAHNSTGNWGAEDPESAKDRQNDFTLVEPSNPAVAATRSDIMQQIIDWVGTRYHFGGANRTGIDCSAFIREVFRKAFNVELPRTASEQSALGDEVGSREDLHFGDLVFFHTARYARVSHVGIYVGDGLFANASCSRGVTVCSLESEYWSKRYLFAKRLFTNSSTASNDILRKLQLAANTTTDNSGAN